MVVLSVRWGWVLTRPNSISACFPKSFLPSLHCSVVRELYICNWCLITTCLWFYASQLDWAIGEPGEEESSWRKKEKDGLAQHCLGKTGQEGGQIPAGLALRGRLGLFAILTQPPSLTWPVPAHHSHSSSLTPRQALGGWRGKPSSVWMAGSQCTHGLSDLAAVILE